MRIDISTSEPVNLDATPHEAVERKGIGHPDTLCDAIAELASKRYSAAVLELTGRLPHHYFDKVMLMGGAADMGLGHGRLVEPYRVLFAGKVTRRAGDVELPVRDILVDAAGDVLSTALRGFDPTEHLVVLDELRDYQGPAKRRPRYRPASVEDMPLLDQPGRVSNDVNICTGFAPLSRCEQLVLDAERYLNSVPFKTEHPYTGMDVKIAGVRHRSSIELTVNMPFIAALVPDMDAYRELTKTLAEDLEQQIARWGHTGVTLDFNPQDVSGLPYLTVTGSVADTGDVGAVGRGNRPNGLITPMRPMSIEAVSGKSPVDNTGKLYGIAAGRVSTAIHEVTSRWNHVTIVTFRDRPLDDPARVLVALDGDGSRDVRESVKATVARSIRETPALTAELVQSGIVAW